MNFGSTLFLFLFLPFSLLLYGLSFLVKVPDKRIKFQNILLLILSCIFIFFASYKFLVVALSMTLINYAGTLLFSLSTKKNSVEKNYGWRRIVYFSLLLFDVFVLAFYKYLPGNEWGTHFVWLDERLMQDVIFPLGLSFYSFSLIRYVVDVFSGKLLAEKNFVNFSLFVLFFPKFVSGPIERYDGFQKQLLARSFSLNQVFDGVIRFVIGLNKKILLVGVLEEMSAIVFSLSPSEWTAPLAWGGIVIFGLHLFIDFDAYTDMAIGLGKIFGFELQENFNFPYLATSVQDFWKRWHISLSRWLQDTILLPFQFQTRRKKPRQLFTIFGILLTFLISGLWHGDSWNFILWGLWHGVFLSLEFLFLKRWLKAMPVFFQRFYTIMIVNLGWVFFRLDSINQIGRFFSVLFVPQKFNGILYRGLLEFTRIDMLLVFGASVLISFGGFKDCYKKMTEKNWIFEAIYIFVLFIFLGISFLQLYNGDYQPFLYGEF